MAYIIKNIIGYMSEDINENWVKLVQNKNEAKQFETKEDAEKYIKERFKKNKDLKIEEFDN